MKTGHGYVVLQDAAKLENGYKVLYPIFGILRNTFSDPCQVSNLLFLQLHVTVKRSILKLLQERLFVEMHFHLEEFVFKLRSDSLAAVALWRIRRIEERMIFHNAIARNACLVYVICPRQLVIPCREKTADIRE